MDAVRGFVLVVVIGVVMGIVTGVDVSGRCARWRSGLVGCLARRVVYWVAC